MKLHPGEKVYGGTAAGGKRGKSTGTLLVGKRGKSIWVHCCWGQEGEKYRDTARREEGEKYMGTLLVGKRGEKYMGAPLGGQWWVRKLGKCWGDKYMEAVMVKNIWGGGNKFISALMGRTSI